MKLNSFLKLIGFIFTAKAIFGVFYLLLGWQAVISQWVLPSWLIVVAVVADALLASVAFSHAKK